MCDGEQTVPGLTLSRPESVLKKWPFIYERHNLKNRSSLARTPHICGRLESTCTYRVRHLNLPPRIIRKLSVVRQISRTVIERGTV